MNPHAILLIRHTIHWNDIKLKPFTVSRSQNQNRSQNAANGTALIGVKQWRTSPLISYAERNKLHGSVIIQEDR